jgi:McrBC 5-methylcytosine restriction system component
MVRERQSVCVETRDCSIVRFPTTALILGQTSRDPQSQGARLGRQFLRRNQAVLDSFGVSGELDYDGFETQVRLTTSTTVGAIPLVSPTTGKIEVGLIIHPRLEWMGLGEMLGMMGWKIVPEILGLPLLPRSARNVPPWVISAIVLRRIEMLLNQLQRRFEFVDADLPAPRGAVRWDTYAATRIPRMQFLSVPCHFPDLRDDRDLKAAIHFALKQQFASLQSQRVAGFFVLQLIEFCARLVGRVNSVAARPPTPALLASWLRIPVRSGVFHDALQAIEWTLEERGMAGVAELQGLAWRMSMDEFYEAWVETIASDLSLRLGGILKIGRKRETVTPISWEKPYLGSQKSLIPDIVIHREAETIVIDAKYKHHWEDIQTEGWHRLAEEIQQRHRGDLMQVLAYSSLFSTPSVIACIAYPCRRAIWESLKRRNLHYHKASVHSGPRRVNLVLTALPMIANAEEAIATLRSAFAA